MFAGSSVTSRWRTVLVWLLGLVLDYKNMAAEMGLVAYHPSRVDPLAEDGREYCRPGVAGSDVRRNLSQGTSIRYLG